LPEVVKAQGTESLKKVSVSSGESSHPNGSYEKKGAIKWTDPNEVYALCSTSRPAIVHTEYSDKTKWVAQFLAPGYPDGMFGYLVETYVEYFKICHDLDPPRSGDLALARKLGYPPGLVLRVSDTPVAAPEDVLLSQGPAPNANQREFAGLNIENKNPFPVKDVTVSCAMKAPSGTVLSHVRNTIYPAAEGACRTLVLG
jgi:hypothetical protein